MVPKLAVAGASNETWGSSVGAIGQSSGTRDLIVNKGPCKPCNLATLEVFFGGCR